MADLSGTILAVSPVLDPKPWGGSKLRDWGLSSRSPMGDPIGEAILTSAAVLIRSGSFKGQTIGDLTEADPLAMCGARGLVMTKQLPIFPLLVKIIDAAEHLSIQVHPTDDLAPPRGPLGKTEAWFILAAEPGASIFAGFRENVTVDEFAAACQTADGQSATLVRQLSVHPMETYVLPAGTVHALGAGVMVYEVQQPSDITLRLDDWGRVGLDGKPRELHLDDGLAAIDTSSRPVPTPPTPRHGTMSRRTELVRTRYFALERLALLAGERVTLSAEDSPQVLTVIEGDGAFWPAREPRAVNPPDAIPLLHGATAVVPAATTTVTGRANQPMVLLRSWVPGYV